jgi:predicted amidohydrolase YtcJ
MEKVKEKIPPFSPEMIEQSLLKAQENCFEVGLTSLDDAGLGKDSIQTLIDLQNQNKLKIRIYAMLSDAPATLKHYFIHGPFKNDRMHVNAIKIYADGSLGSRGACLKEEYADQKGHYGFMLHSKKYFEELAEKALNYKFQLCTHVIGDSAAKEIIDVYTNHLSSDNRRRWRLEHCQVMDERERKKLSDYSIIPSVQPTHATSDMYWAEERLGKERMKYAYAYEDIREASDGFIAYGTDFPVENINPMYTLYAAIERKDLQGKPKGGFQIENKTKRKDALRAMTLGAAYANFEEEEKGSIEEGKFADFIILDKDIMKVDEKEIPSIKVLATFIDGEKVFERK